MSNYRLFTTAFKRQVAEEYVAGASLHALSRKHGVARNLIRIWVAKYQAGEFEPDFVPMPRLGGFESGTSICWSVRSFTPGTL